MGKFRRQLLLSYLPLVLVPVILIGLVTRGVAEQRITLLVSQEAARRTMALAPCFSAYYAQHGTWDSLPSYRASPNATFILALNYPPGAPTDSTGRTASSALMIFNENGPVDCFIAPGAGNRRIPRKSIGRGVRSSPMGGQRDSDAGNGADNRAQPITLQPPPGVRVRVQAVNVRPQELLIADPEGNVVMSNDNTQNGQRLSMVALASGAPLYVQEQLIGYLVIGTMLGAIDDTQRDFLNTVNGALVLSGAVSVALAVGLGWWMSFQIAAPVRALMNGARRLARGQWDTPIKVTASNELGDLTEAFNHMAAEIMRQQQMNRQMVADIAHDLRTPLASMALEIEAVEAGFQDPAQAVPSLREEIIWLQRMVNDLRLLSLMDADQIHLQRETVPLSEFLCGVYDFWQPLADDAGRELRAEVPANLPHVSIDPGRLRQTIGNLIDNAIRHTPQGKRITLRATAEPGYALIAVADEGEGIPPEDLPRLFDRFYRVDPARVRRDGGSGLGLSIAKRLIEMHGGQISVESQLGHGATFTIRLPV
jgi:signal transduction histidine kinase